MRKSRYTEEQIVMALGAGPAEVGWLVVARGMGLVAPGILIGLPGALMGARFIQSVLFGVSAADPLTFLEVSLALAVIVFVACLGPALQAAHGNPVEVMRAE